MGNDSLSNSQAQEKSQKGAITMWGAVFLGIGSMVGAGIFTLLGQAGKIAGTAVWVSFILGGIIALLCGYSFAKLGVRYPSRGGLVEYITQAFGSGTFTGGSSVLFYIANIVGMAMIASSFGEYCALLIFGQGYAQIWVNILASLLVVGLTAVNFIGAETVSKAETIIVLFKLIILVIFTVATLILIDPSKLAPATWPPFNLILASLALTFLAYAGFNVISNTAEDMGNPQRDIPRATYTAIGITIVLYVAIALAIFGTLNLQEIQDNAETVLAVAAQPVFGQVGFVVMSLGALAATASAVNANLYGSANITYTLAKEGELPKQFKHRMWGSNEGLLITAVGVLIVTNLFPLNVIASIASATFLLIYLLVNGAHYRLREQTGGNQLIIILALAACLFALALWANHTYASQPQSLLVVSVFIAISFAAEAIIQRTRKRKIRPRVK